MFGVLGFRVWGLGLWFRVWGKKDVEACGGGGGGGTFFTVAMLRTILL